MENITGSKFVSKTVQKYNSTQTNAVSQSSSKGPIRNVATDWFLYTRYLHFISLFWHHHYFLLFALFLLKTALLSVNQIQKNVFLYINNKSSYWLAQGMYVCQNLKRFHLPCLKISWSFIFVFSISKLSVYPGHHYIFKKVWTF